MRNLLLTLPLTTLLLANPTMASDEPYLLGDWGGARTYLEDRGVTTEAVITLDFMQNVSGGVDTHGTMLGNYDLTFEVDSEKAGLWKNGTFFLYVLGNTVNNRPLTEIVGDIQGTSNIEAEESLKIYEAWYEHRFSNDTVSFLVGLQDYNSEFDVLEYSGLFLNSSPGIQPTISQVGPSIFPMTTAMTGRLKYHPTEDAYILTSIADGISSDPDHPTRTAVKFDDGDRIFAAFEGGVSHGAPMSKEYYKIAVGSWLHTARVELFNGSTNSENKGFYLIGEKTLYSENDNGEGLGAFIELGYADEDLNQIATYWSAGINYVGLIPNRNADILGLAVACARNGDDYMNYTKAGGDDVNHSETAIELTYRAEVLPWLVVQPDVQYVINPSMDPSLDDALVIGIRMEVSL